MVQFENKPKTTELAVSTTQFLSVDSTVEFFHGSNSASLEGIIKQGLQPFGELTSVPFSGTLDVGITKDGINNYSVSAVKAELAPRAYDYTTSKLEGWNPYVHEKINADLTENLNRLDSQKNRLEKRIADGASVSDTDKMILQHFDHEISRINKNLDLEQKRAETWSKLNDEQRDLIKNPFPVLYGIKHNGETSAVRSGVSGERGLPKVEPQNLIIFVLPEHVEKAEGMVRSLGSKIPVKSIFNITENIAESSEWMRKDIQHIKIQFDRATQDRLLYSDKPEERLKGIQLLKNKSPLPGNAETKTILMLEDPAPTVKISAAATLGDIGTIASFRHLKALAPNDPLLKEAVENSIFQLRIKLDAEYKSRTEKL